ncbi:MAG TPA: hypothetical protein VIG90_17085, partial [Pedomonas sp.]|uniref:hypothetical protein n=1 Tax=Pedomonas sp. TaxID=2976421 RepID=UPI002F3E77E0
MKSVSIGSAIILWRVRYEAGLNSGNFAEISQKSSLLAYMKAAVSGLPRGLDLVMCYDSDRIIDVN